MPSMWRIRPYYCRQYPDFREIKCQQQRSAKFNLSTATENARCGRTGARRHTSCALYRLMVNIYIISRFSVISCGNLFGIATRRHSSAWRRMKPSTSYIFSPRALSDWRRHRAWHSSSAQCGHCVMAVRYSWKATEEKSRSLLMKTSYLFMLAALRH